MTNQIKNCTAETPMPEDWDQSREEWYHHGARPKEPGGDIWTCPHCSHEFKITRRKITINEAIDKVRDLKRRGLRFPEGDDPC